MAEHKQNRWVKIHEQGQANYDETENVMDIRLGQNRLMAEATYTVRSYKKAAFWLNKYLESADALQVVASEIIEQITAAAESANREDEQVTASGEGWQLEIDKMDKGIFKVSLNWSVDEEVTKKAKKKPSKKRKAEEPKAEEAPKRKRRKKGESTDAPNA